MLGTLAGTRRAHPSVIVEARFPCPDEQPRGRCYKSFLTVSLAMLHKQPHLEEIGSSLVRFDLLVLPRIFDHDHRLNFLPVHDPLLYR